MNPRLKHPVYHFTLLELLIVIAIIAILLTSEMEFLSAIFCNLCDED